MRTLRATPGPQGWVLSLHPCQRDESAVREEMAQALVRGREHLLDWYRQERELPEAWRLEVAKAAVDDGEIALGLAQRLSERCLADPSLPHEVSGPATLLDRATFERFFRWRGLTPIAAVPAWGGRISDAMALLVATLGYAVLWLRAPGRLPRGATRLFAMHGEVSTRTRHLLALLASDAAPGAVLVLGRPRLSLASLRVLWREAARAQLPALVRPWSRASLWRALPAGLALLSAAPRAWRLAPCAMPWRERTAQAWRCLAGTASAQWWREQASDCKGVVFGHTGTAEAHLLERAMQATGVRTVHAAHGLSGGMNFVGNSDVALWRCGRDAAWHRAVGGYGQSLHSAAECPEPAEDGQGTLLLSNLAHPMNPLYRWAGLAPEREAVAVAAQHAAGPRGQRPLRWRPHPVSAALPAADRACLEKIAIEHGAERLQGAVDLQAEIQRAGRIFCTPSSVVVDVLLAGKVPGLVGDMRWAGQLALRQPDAGAGWPAPTGDAPAKPALATAWEAMQPARPLTLSQLYEALA